MVKFFSVLIISFILGIFKTTIIFIISYILLRHFGGGVHLSTYYRCLTVGLIIFILLGGLATREVNIIFLVVMVCVTFLTGIYIIIKWAPARTDKESMIDKNEKITQKKKCFAVLTLLCVGNTAFIKFNLLDCTFASVLGMIASLFFMTPWGYRVINILDDTLNQIQGDYK